MVCAAVKTTKIFRQKKLKELVEQNPFITDEEIAQNLGVSIQTVRLYRLELGIPELRKRIKSMAEKAHSQVKTISGKEIVGELVDLELNNRGISILETTEEMVFQKTKTVRGQYIFEQANTLAIAVIDADIAVTGVAKIRYKKPVYIGMKLIAKAEVTRRRGNKFFVTVVTKAGCEEVFRGKFILVSFEEFQKEGGE